MLEILRGATCRDLAYDFLHADRERTANELRDAALEMYGEVEWEFCLAAEQREREILA